MAHASTAATTWVMLRSCLCVVSCVQGMAALQPFVEQAEGAQKLSNLHMHRQV
jgi:hypothetical protein